MATIITMPAAVADATGAALQDWLVSVGDTVEAGQPIAEIETDKAILELEADAPGTVGRLVVDTGVMVDVGDPIAVLIDGNEDEAAIDRALAAAGGGNQNEAENPVPQDTEAPTTPRNPHGTAVDNIEESSGDPSSPDSRIFISPLARKVAQKLGIEISAVTGSGPNGRILRRDVENAARQHTVEPVEEPMAADTDTSADSPNLHTVPDEGNFHDVPLSGMRKAIARRLTESKTTVPHFYVTLDVEMDELLALRRQINDNLATTTQKTTVNDLLLKALGGALCDVPAANASWQGESIRRYDNVDISVAIATDDGLLTPVIRGVENRSLSSLCRIMTDYKERAEAGRIRQQELEGGSFSLTNLGMYGTREFSAILNPPQAGILAVGAAEQRPVVREGELAVATLMSCTLSADHRVIDGAVAAQLLAAFKRRIENPMSILL